MNNSSETIPENEKAENSIIEIKDRERINQREQVSAKAIKETIYNNSLYGATQLISNQEQGIMQKQDEVLKLLSSEERAIIHALLFAMDIPTERFVKDALMFYAKSIVENPMPIGYTLCAKIKANINRLDGA